MDTEFTKYLSEVHEELEQLLDMNPVTMEAPLVGAPTGVVYLFSKNDNYLYVGRSKRQLNTRLRGAHKKIF